MTAKTYSISELARELDVTTRTIRFYEEQGMLLPTRRGQERIYTPKDRVALKLILRGKRFGFSLEEIRQLLDMYDRDGSNEAQLLRTYDIAKDRLAQMEAQRAELDVAIADLKTQLAEGEKALAAFRKTASAA